MRIALGMIVGLVVSCGAGTSLLPEHTCDLGGAAFEQAGFRGAFVSREADAKELVCFSTKECATQYPPASTFKIPHALIALDAGVLDGPDHLMTWDGETRWLDAWNRDLTLADAIRVSALWYFQRVAPLVGRERMQRALDAFEYGNHTIGPDLDAFWIDDTLRISPIEQVAFWHKLHAGELPVSEEARTQVLAMTELARDGDTVLRGKTGWFRMEGRTNYGWFTGCLDGEKRVCFATILFADEPFDHRAFMRARLDVSRKLLEQRGYKVPR